MELCRRGEGASRRASLENAPTVEVLFGGTAGGPDVGVVRVVVPPGGGMPEHEHGGSDVVLVALAGSLEIHKGPETVTVQPGDAVLIRREERVSVRNPGQAAAEAIVSAGPPTFVAGIRNWPEARSS